MAAPPTVHPAVRAQTLAALLFLAVMLGILGALAALTRCAALENWIEARRMAWCRQTKQSYVFSDYFQNAHDLWMYNELPQAEFPKGGVYFLGASDVELSTEQWNLPPALQGLVHNYGLGACNHQGDLDVIRCLVEDHGLLKAGGEKTLVVLGLSYQTTCAPGKTLHITFTNLMELHGLFDFDAHGRLHDVPMNPVSKFLDFEQTHYGVFMDRISELISDQISRWRHHGVPPARVHDIKRYLQMREDEMGPDWRRKIDDSSPVLRELIDYLKARQVQVRVILMFQSSWNATLAYNAEYKRQVTAICAEEHVPVTDWSELLGDDDFGDGTHPNLDGMAKTHAAFLKIAVPFLRSTGALPENVSIPEADAPLSPAPAGLSR